MSSWNEFQRANKGKGYSRAEMSRLYRESRAHTRAASSPNDSISADLDRLITGSEGFHTTPFPDGSRSARRPNAWNEFRREYAGQGLSMRELCEIYHGQKRQNEPEILSSPPPTRWTGHSPPETPRPSHIDSRPSLREDSSQVHLANTESDRAARLAAAEHRAHEAERERARSSTQVTGARKSSTTRPSKTVPTRQKAQHASVSRSLFQEDDKVVATRGRDRQTDSPGSARLSKRELNRDQELPSRTTLDEKFQELQPVPDDGVAYFNPSRVSVSFPLGEEGFDSPSSVWAGEVDGIPVAVKFVGPAEATTEASLRSDVAAMIRAENQHFVAPFGYTHVELEDDSLALAVVMELMPEGDLRSAFRRGRWTLQQKREALFQVLDALEFLHRQNIAHRNLNPSTILLSRENDVAKLRDFGLATFKDQAPADDSSFRSLWHEVSVEAGPEPGSREDRECSVCTFINPRSAGSCEMCSALLANTATESARLAVSDWECIKCTLVNKCTNEVCEACGGSRLATMECNSEIEQLLLETARDKTSHSSGAASSYLPPEVNQHFKDKKKGDIYSFTVLVVEVLLECHMPTQDGQPSSMRVNGRTCPPLRDLIQQGCNQDPNARPGVDVVRHHLTEVFAALGI